MLGLKVLSVESDSPGDHELFGVLDPTAKTLQAGAVGVGTRVTMKGKKAATLIDLIIGKKVEGTSEKEVHYVRRAGQDPDLHHGRQDRQALDQVRRLDRAGPAEAQQLGHPQDRNPRPLGRRGQRRLVQRGEITLGYDDAATPKWKMLEDRKLQQGATGRLSRCRPTKNSTPPSSTS